MGLKASGSREGPQLDFSIASDRHPHRLGGSRGGALDEEAT
jgi:hypothetical protein